MQKDHEELDCRLNNSEECGPGREKSETNPSNHHFPSTPVKHLADLRIRANSQRYSSIYEDWRPKIEDIERSDDRKTSRTNLTSLKPAEDFFLFLSSSPPEFLLPFCPSFLFYSFFLPSFTLFIPSSCLLLFILLF